MRNTGNRTREAREEKGKKGKKGANSAAAEFARSRGVSAVKKNPCKRLAGGFIYSSFAGHLSEKARSILASRFLIGHFAHCGSSPGSHFTVTTAFAPVPCATAFPVPITDRAGWDLSMPRSQSAEQEWTRQMVASTSTLGQLTPLSYFAYCTRFMPIVAENEACDSDPRSSFSLVANVLIKI